MRRASRVSLIVLLLAVLAGLIWLRATREGQDIAQQIHDRFIEWKTGADDRDAAAKLKAMGVLFTRSQPPESHVGTLGVTDKTLGDDGYRAISACVWLLDANFMRCDIDDRQMEHLAGLTHMTSLGIYDAPGVTDAGLRYLTQMHGMASLKLRGTQITDAGLIVIVQFPDLKILDLSGTKVSDAGMLLVASMRSLNWLLLKDTQVSDEGIAKLAGMSDLQQISLSGSQVTAEGHKRLKEMYPGVTID